MKRNMDLVLHLLQEIEKAPDADGAHKQRINTEGYDRSEIEGHLHLLQDEKLIVRMSTERVRLTWKGHDYLEAHAS